MLESVLTGNEPEFVCVQVCPAVSQIWLHGNYIQVFMLAVLIPRDDLRVVFAVMVFLSMGHEGPVRRPETIAFWN